MAKLDLNVESAETFKARVSGIASDDQRQWGNMSAEEAVRHLCFMLELSLGEQQGEKLPVPMPGFLMWVLFFNWFTNWPKAKFDAPANFLPAAQDDLDAARTTCIEAIDRFVHQLESQPEQIGFSPLLGNIPLRKWARVHGVHMDHHLRQFGV